MKIAYLDVHKEANTPYGTLLSRNNLCAITFLGIRFVWLVI